MRAIFSKPRAADLTTLACWLILSSLLPLVAIIAPEVAHGITPTTTIYILLYPPTSVLLFMLACGLGLLYRVRLFRYLTILLFATSLLLPFVVLAHTLSSASHLEFLSNSDVATNLLAVLLPLSILFVSTIVAAKGLQVLLDPKISSRFYRKNKTN